MDQNVGYIKGKSNPHIKNTTNIPQLPKII